MASTSYAYCYEAAALIGDRRYGGTKLIWDYFPELFQAGELSELRTALAPLLDLDPVFLRLRRGDIEAQAVSRSLASQTGVDHRYRGLKVLYVKLVSDR